LIVRIQAAPTHPETTQRVLGYHKSPPLLHTAKECNGTCWCWCHRVAQYGQLYSLMQRKNELWLQLSSADAAKLA
jgi:hypothetical protein